NVHNPGSKGYLPVVLLGSDGVSGDDIDPASVRMSRADCTAGSVAANQGPHGPRPQVEDVCTPVESDAACPCHVNAADGVDDLTLHFDSLALASALQLGVHGQTVEIAVTGTIRKPGSPLDGQTFVSFDCLHLTGGGGKSAHEDRTPVPDP